MRNERNAVGRTANANERRNTRKRGKWSGKKKEKKSSFGGASKYLKQSELATTVTKKVVSNDDGLLCAEIIREFLEFYSMEHSLHVFVPEMSLGAQPAKTRLNIEREIGLEKEPSKPLLLMLVEQCKFGGGGGNPMGASGQ